MKDQTREFVEYHEVYIAPPLKIFHAPLDAIPSFQHIDCTTHFPVADKDVKHYQSQYQSLGMSPITDFHFDTKPLTATLQPILCPLSCPSWNPCLSNLETRILCRKMSPASHKGRQYQLLFPYPPVLYPFNTVVLLQPSRYFNKSRIHL